MPVLETMTSRHKKILLIACIVLAAVLIAAVVTLGVILANDDHIYKGIYVNDIPLGGLSLEQAAETLENHYRFENVSLPFSFDGTSFSVASEAVALQYGCFETAMSAYDMGRDDNFFVRLKNVIVFRFQKQVLPVQILYDEQKLLEAVNQNIADHVTPAVQTQVVLNGDRMEITNGKAGMGVDAARLGNQIRETFGFARDIVPFEVIVETKNPEPLTADLLYERYHAEPKDVAFEVVDGKMHYENHVLGVDFDKAEAARILEENKDNAETYFIPITITVPQKDARWFADNYAYDTLGTFTTTFSTINAGRAANIALAAEKINGYVLAPGDVFSFNAVVGRRAEDTGFKTAKVYQAGEIVDGIGGGICQVSSTLYNAVLLADLDVISRTNHSMPVSYVANGRDATVSYDDIDFIFANNQDCPVKVGCVSENGKIMCTIYGLKNEDKVVEISTETVQVIPFTVKRVTDKSLAPGKTRMSQSGSNGSIVNTYKTVYIDGQQVSHEQIARSVYQSIQQVVLVGPEKKPANPAAPPSAKPEAPSVPTDAKVFFETNLPPFVPEEEPSGTEPDGLSQTE